MIKPPPQYACLNCGTDKIHPTGATRHWDSRIEYGPTVGVAAVCECGVPVEIQVGTRKGALIVDIVQLTAWGAIRAAR